MTTSAIVWHLAADEQAQIAMCDAPDGAVTGREESVTCKRCRAYLDADRLDEIDPADSERLSLAFEAHQQLDPHCTCNDCIEAFSKESES